LKAHHSDLKQVEGIEPSCGVGEASPSIVPKSKKIVLLSEDNLESLESQVVADCCVISRLQAKRGGKTVRHGTIANQFGGRDQDQAGTNFEWTLTHGSAERSCVENWSRAGCMFLFPGASQALIAV
jgi:hypothetical protein